VAILEAHPDAASDVLLLADVLVRASHLSCLPVLIRAGITTLGRLDVTADVGTEPRNADRRGILRIWHRGGALWSGHIERMFSQLTTRPAAKGIVKFLCGECGCADCRRPPSAPPAALSAHGWAPGSCPAEPQEARAVELAVVVTQECEHMEPPSVADGTEEIIAEVMWADHVERSILAGEHLGSAEEQIADGVRAAGEEHVIASAWSGPSSSSQPTASSGGTKVYPQQASLRGVSPALQQGQLPSHGSVSHGAGGRCVVCKPNLPGADGCKAGRTCYKCHVPHDPGEVTRGGGRSRQRRHKRVMKQTRYSSPDPFEKGELQDAGSD